MRCGCRQVTASWAHMPAAEWPAGCIPARSGQARPGRLASAASRSNSLRVTAAPLPPSGPRWRPGRSPGGHGQSRAHRERSSVGGRCWATGHSGCSPRRWSAPTCCRSRSTWRCRWRSARVLGGGPAGPAGGERRAWGGAAVRGLRAGRDRGAAVGDRPRQTALAPDPGDHRRARSAGRRGPGRTPPALRHLSQPGRIILALAPVLTCTVLLTLGATVVYPFEMDTIVTLAQGRLVATHYRVYNTLSGMVIALGNLLTGAAFGAAQHTRLAACHGPGWPRSARSPRWPSGIWPGARPSRTATADPGARHPTLNDRAVPAGYEAPGPPRVVFTRGSGPRLLPGGQLADLALLGRDDLLGELLDLGQRAIPELGVGHLDRALVVAGHHVDEGQVEPGTLEALELIHLAPVHHARHRHLVMIHACHGFRLAPASQPTPHVVDLLALGGGDVAGQLDQLGAGGAALDELGHLDGLLVMRDHALREGHVGLVGLRRGRRLRVLVGCLAAGGKQRHGCHRHCDASHRWSSSRSACLLDPRIADWIWIGSAAHVRDTHSSTGDRARGRIRWSAAPQAAAAARPDVRMARRAPAPSSSRAASTAKQVAAMSTPAGSVASRSRAGCGCWSMATASWVAAPEGAMGPCPAWP